MSEEKIYNCRYEDLMFKIESHMRGYFVENKKLKISDEFKREFMRVIAFISNMESGKKVLHGYRLNNERVAWNIMYEFFNNVNEYSDDIDIYNKFLEYIPTSEFISDETKAYATTLLNNSFTEVYPYYKLYEFECDRKYRSTIELNEEEFISIMDEHHRCKWGDDMRFVIQKDRVPANTYSLSEVKPIYLYKNDNSRFILNEDLIKTILNECFDDYVVESIELITSYNKIEWEDLRNRIRIDEKGCPIDQESMSIMRHPVERGIVEPKFDKIKIHVREKRYEKEHNYSLKR
jgi:hypothetical protein